MTAPRPRPEPSRRAPTPPNPSGGLQAPSRALSALFGVAVLGVLVAGGLLAHVLGGLPVALGYAAVAVVLVALGVVKVRRLVAAAAPPPRQPCTCCAPGEHLKPIEVV